MTKKKARWWLESIVRNHGGILHRAALDVIFPDKGESRPTVRRKPAQQPQSKIPRNKCRGIALCPHRYGARGVYCSNRWQCKDKVAA